MAQVVLNGEQFRKLVAGKVVSTGCCEIRLGDVGFDLIQVKQVGHGKGVLKKRPQLIKRPK